jgi:hypothetical protein
LRVFELLQGEILGLLLLLFTVELFIVCRVVSKELFTCSKIHEFRPGWPVSVSTVISSSSFLSGRYTPEGKSALKIQFLNKFNDDDTCSKIVFSMQIFLLAYSLPYKTR